MQVLFMVEVVMIRCRIHQNLSKPFYVFAFAKLARNIIEVNCSLLSRIPVAVHHIFITFKKIEA